MQGENNEKCNIAASNVGRFVSKYKQHQFISKNNWISSLIKISA